MEFDLAYKLQEFRKVQSGYYDQNGKRYSSTPIGTENAEIMLELINELESALGKAETDIRQLTIPVVVKEKRSETPVCPTCDGTRLVYINEVIKNTLCPDC